MTPPPPRQKVAAFFDVPTDHLLRESTPKLPGKRGPRSKLELQFERLRTLPKAEQDLAAQLLDRLLAAAK